LNTEEKINEYIMPHWGTKSGASAGCRTVWVPSRALLKTLFYFSHDYYKLQNDAFTTIRSVYYMNRRGIGIGSKGWITLQNRKLFLAIIMGYKDARICDIPLEVLKNDAEYLGFLIASHQDFVDLLNSFTRFKQNCLTTVKRVFFIQRIGGRHS